MVPALTWAAKASGTRTEQVLRENGRAMEWSHFLLPRLRLFVEISICLRMVLFAFMICLSLFSCLLQRKAALPMEFQFHYADLLLQSVSLVLHGWPTDAGIAKFTVPNDTSCVEVFSLLKDLAN